MLQRALVYLGRSVSQDLAVQRTLQPGGRTGGSPGTDTITVLLVFWSPLSRLPTEPEDRSDPGSGLPNHKNYSEFNAEWLIISHGMATR